MVQRRRIREKNWVADPLSYYSVLAAHSQGVTEISERSTDAGSHMGNPGTKVARPNSCGVNESSSLGCGIHSRFKGWGDCANTNS